MSNADRWYMNLCMATTITALTPDEHTKWVAFVAMLVAAFGFVVSHAVPLTSMGDKKNEQPDNGSDPRGTGQDAR